MTSLQRWQMLSIDPHTLHLAWFGDFSSDAPAADAEQIALTIDRHRTSPADWKEVELELHDCENVDSRGFALLLFVHRHLSQDIPRWRVSGAPDSFRRMIAIMNLQHVFLVERKEFESARLLFEDELASAVERVDPKASQDGRASMELPGELDVEPSSDDDASQRPVFGPAMIDGERLIDTENGDSKPFLTPSTGEAESPTNEPPPAPTGGGFVGGQGETSGDEDRNYQLSPLEDGRPG